MSPNVNFFYAAESLLGVIGIYPLLMNLFHLENPNPLETRLKWIFFSLMSLFLVRIPFQAFNNPISNRLTYAVATLLVLSIFLYFETLFRRHMSIILKVIAAVWTVLFLVDTIFLDFIYEKSHLIAFGIYAFILQAGLILFAIFRKRSDYTKSENSLINISCFTLIVLVLFFLSDVKVFAEILKFSHFGVFGALLFTYAAFHDQSIKTRNILFLKRFVKMVLFSSLLVAILLTLVPNYDQNFIAHIFTLFMIVNLVIRIHFISKEAEGEQNFYKFVEKIVESDKTNLNMFLKDLELFFDRVEIKTLSEEDLKNYNLKKINSFFDYKVTHLFNSYDLRNELQQENNANDLEVMEQMIDILEKYEMSHICRVNKKYNLFVIFNFHMIGQSNALYTQTALISEISKMLDKRA